MTLPEGYKSWFQLYKEAIKYPYANGMFKGFNTNYIAGRALEEIIPLLPGDERSLDLMMDECDKEWDGCTLQFLTTLKKIV